MDLKQFADPVQKTAVEPRWIRAGYVRHRINKEGKPVVSAMIQAQIFVTFDSSGNMILNTGNNNRTIIPPTPNSVNAVYKLGKSAISISLQDLAKVLVGERGTTANIMGPPKTLKFRDITNIDRNIE